MRILYDSKLLAHKDPFGTLTPGQECKINIHIPSSVQATTVVCRLVHEDYSLCQDFTLRYRMKKGSYEIFTGEIVIDEPGLYFYCFHITTKSGCFRLFKAGDDTNMEDGDLWQVICIPADFTTPDWAKGAVIYQVFPDRFNRSGRVNLAGKLEPYTVH